MIRVFGASVALFAAVRAADLTGDHVVNGADLSRLLTAWTTGDIGADLNGDGRVDGRDISAMLINYGRAWGRADIGDGQLWITDLGERAVWAPSPFGGAYRRLTATRASDGPVQSIDQRIRP